MTKLCGFELILVSVTAIVGGRGGERVVMVINRQTGDFLQSFRAAEDKSSQW